MQAEKVSSGVQKVGRLPASLVEGVALWGYVKVEEELRVLDGCVWVVWEEVAGANECGLRCSCLFRLAWCCRSCPVVKMGKLCIEVGSKDKIAFISEDLCIGCGICSRK
jgi:hypothetical protein